MRSFIDLSCPPGSSQLSRARHCASSVSRAAAATSAARRVEQAEQEQSGGSASMSRASRQMLGGCPQRLRRRLEICRCVAYPALQPAGPGCCRPQGAALALPQHLQAQHFAQHCLVMLSGWLCLRHGIGGGAAATAHLRNANRQSWQAPDPRPAAGPAALARCCLPAACSPLCCRHDSAAAAAAACSASLGALLPRGL